MVNHSTDTQFGNAKQDSIDYWLTIDQIDSELSGTTIKYNSSIELAAAVGIDPQNERKMLFRLRRRLGTQRAMMR
jgi:hypothetical protein